MADEYVPSYATAVLPVFAWVQTNDWVDAFGAHVHEFYNGLVELFEEPANDVLEELPTPLWARAVRCCFDDFLTVEYEANPSNVLDHYIDEFGSGLESADADFLAAFRNSVVRVYYVDGRTPDESVVLREVSSGARSVQIEDELLTAALTGGDTIATRIVTVGDKDYLAGSVLVLGEAALEGFKEWFETAFKEEMRTVEKYLQTDLRTRNAVRQRLLTGTSSAVSNMWVTTVLATLMDTAPLANDDDPDTVFQASIGYESEIEPLVEYLEAHPDLDRPLPKELLWLWHTDGADPEASVKAMIWISGPEIVLESCARSRIEAAVGTLLDVLGGAAGEVKIREIEREVEVRFDLDEEEDDEEEGEDEPWPVPALLPGEDESALHERIHAFLDHQIGTTLDHPVSELRDQIPRELAKTAKGRKQLTKWLASLEARLRAHSEDLGLPGYDFTWMWKELGLESHRQSSLFE